MYYTTKTKKWKCTENDKIMSVFSVYIIEERYKKHFLFDNFTPL